MTPPERHRAAVFTDIWTRNLWGSAESRSGPGSGVARTAQFREALESFLAREKPHLLYDAPCGDFVWMSHVRLPAGVDYLGADIVAPLIAENESKHGRPGVAFAVADIVAAPPPDASAWLCRESLFHLPIADILAVLAHWRASAIPWFLATTTPLLSRNTECPVGGWRPLNLEIEPFHMGPPDERFPDAAPSDPSKIVGAWRKR